MIARRHLLGAATAVIALGAGGAAEARANARTLIDRFMRTRMEAKGVPGAGVAVLRAGRPLRVAAYGQASIEWDVAADTRTVFPMASSSKMLAGLAAALLSERGRLDLDGSIRDHLSELPARFDAVRVHHLLSHTSGLGGLGANPAYVAEAAQREMEERTVDDLKLDPFTPAELIAYGAEVPFAREPGAAWQYAQYPYFLFGQIVRRASGVAYDAFVANDILRPLGMNDTHYGDHRAVIARRGSTNYTRQFGPLQNYALRYSPNYWPAAGLNTTADDAARLLTAFEPERLVSQASLSRLWRPTTLNDGSAFPYGLGFGLGEHQGRRWVGHEGGGCCYMSWFPTERLGIAILLNLSGSHEDGIDLALASEIFGAD
jgi:CubicO group peptidase (beta-lactamase class C family)